MNYVPIWARVLLGIALVVFFVGWFALKWRRAGDVVTAEAKHRSFQLVQQDARFGWLMQQIATRSSVVTSGVAPPASYRLIYACFYGQANEEVAAPGVGARSRPFSAGRTTAGS